MKVFGEIGILADDGERVQCHLCGKWYIHLGCHVVKTHHMEAQEYKARFGLANIVGLASSALKSHLGEVNGERLTAYAHSRESLPFDTSPQAQAERNRTRAVRTSTKKKHAENWNSDSLHEAARAAHKTDEYRAGARQRALAGHPFLSPETTAKARKNSHTPEAIAKRLKTIAEKKGKQD